MELRLWWGQRSNAELRCVSNCRNSDKSFRIIYRLDFICKKVFLWWIYQLFSLRSNSLLPWLSGSYGRFLRNALKEFKLNTVLTTCFKLFLLFLLSLFCHEKKGRFPFILSLFGTRDFFPFFTQSIAIALSNGLMKARIFFDFLRWLNHFLNQGGGEKKQIWKRSA